MLLALKKMWQLFLLCFLVAHLTQTQVIRLPEWTPATVERFLRLCYLDTVEGTLQELVNLIELCHLYQAEELLTAVVEAVLPLVDTNNALQLYDFGITYSGSLKQRALRETRHHPWEVLTTSSHVAKMNPDAMTELLHDDGLVLEEKQVKDIAQPLHYHAYPLEYSNGPLAGLNSARFSACPFHRPSLPTYHLPSSPFPFPWTSASNGALVIESFCRLLNPSCLSACHCRNYRM